MIPKNPITIAINKALMENALKKLNERYLPNYDILVTSFYRSPEDNKKKGGSEDSAHMYGLAEDYVLQNKATGKTLTDYEMERVFNQFIKPNWHGYTYFKPKQKNTSTGWIHSNLERDITKYTMWAGAAAVTVGSFYLFKKFKDNLTLNKGA